MPPKRQKKQQQGIGQPVGRIRHGDAAEQQGPPPLWDRSVSCEDKFLDAMQDGTTVCICGSRGTGKSIWSLSFIRHALVNKLYSRYYLVCPCWNFEANGTYMFIPPLAQKTGAKVVVFNMFNELVCERIMKELIGNDESGLLYIDDSTAHKALFRAGNIDDQDPMTQLWILARHIKLSTVLCCHTLKGVLSTKCRNNLAFVMYTRIPNAKLLNVLWEEFYSTCSDWQSFVDFTLYHQRAEGREFGMVCMSVADRMQEIDVWPTEWKCIKPHTKAILAFIEGKKAKPAPPLSDSDSDGTTTDSE